MKSEDARKILVDLEARLPSLIRELHPELCDEEVGMTVAFQSTALWHIHDMLQFSQGTERLGAIKLAMDMVGVRSKFVPKTNSKTKVSDS